MTAEQRAKVWQLVDRISDIAQEVDIFAQDIKRDTVNREHLKTCHNVTGRLLAISAILESVAYPESKSE